MTYIAQVSTNINPNQEYDASYNNNLVTDVATIMTFLNDTWSRRLHNPENSQTLDNTIYGTGTQSGTTFIDWQTQDWDTSGVNPSLPLLGYAIEVNKPYIVQAQLNISLASNTQAALQLYTMPSNNLTYAAATLVSQGPLTIAGAGGLGTAILSCHDTFLTPTANQVLVVGVYYSGASNTTMENSGSSTTNGVRGFWSVNKIIP